jgi:hypothetical protein
VKEVGLCVQVPVVGVNVWPTWAVIVGTELFVGMMSMTALVAALVAGELDPPEFVATAETANVLPTSAATGTYAEAVAPAMAFPARFH